MRFDMFDIWNRRYTGSKFKLQDWIEDVITKHCKIKSLCDIFAGTAIVSQKFSNKVDRLIINDFLYSNEVIYKGFFGGGKCDYVLLEKYVKKFNDLNVKKIKDNYVSENFGGRYFSQNDALLIGEIREQIDTAKDLSDKERAVLLSSLLYSADKSANTVGHYDAYIKGKKLSDTFSFALIKQYKSKAKIDIFREDANKLARKIKCDLVYIDPPYNSRQYSRFYHVLENIAKWEKPVLSGEAFKPQPENMSEYCRAGARDAFEDLIRNLNCKYVLVSYNNTYNSKSSSSKNKMTLDNIKEILSKKGEVSTFEMRFNAFNAGKTDLQDHKEFLFLVKVKKHKDSYDYARSPFFYVGDKIKIIPQLMDNFPHTINKFIEPFCGGGTVFLNVKAKKYLVNDIDSYIIELHKFLNSFALEPDKFWNICNGLISKYRLSASYLNTKIPEKLRLEYPKTYFAEYNKIAYKQMREDYNREKKNYMMLYLLLIYGFNRMLRFNQKGDFNLPVGNVDFNNNVVSALNKYFEIVKNRNIEFYSYDFEQFLKNIKFVKNDFIYLDPPYLITFSEYNKLWNEETEIRLLELLDKLNSQDVKFAISNIIKHRGKYNKIFDTWSKKYNVVATNSNYISFHDNTQKGSLEVLVKNY